MMPRIGRQLDGPPFALPRVLDQLTERWWRSRPRTRAAIGMFVAASMVLAGIGHVAASPYGPPVDVHLAARDLAIGETLAPSDLRRASWPSDLVPDGATATPTGVVVAPLPRGAVVTDRHLGVGGVAAGLPTGMVAVAVPLDALPELPVGARLDVVGAALDGRGTRLTADAFVLAVDAVSVWIAVERSDAVGITAAAASGTIAVIVLPP